MLTHMPLIVSQNVRELSNNFTVISGCGFYSCCFVVGICNISKRYIIRIFVSGLWKKYAGEHLTTDAVLNCRILEILA